MFVFIHNHCYDVYSTRAAVVEEHDTQEAAHKQATQDDCHEWVGDNWFSRYLNDFQPNSVPEYAP